jgi:hypothetical protein
LSQSDDNLWPDWNSPATKGDLIKAMVTIRGCIIDTYIALGSLARDDKAGYRKAYEDLSRSDDALSKLIDEIGGDTAK